ncbi:MAG: energy-coupling factor transporter transmembrane protein EcfT [Firmicutes bacterium]|nr:energy-coupling factor transporter transmembrane protein EcfT [Bacillota bacterium]
MAIRDITLGQYYPAESAVHRLDPRTKILGTLVFLVSLFLVKNFTGFAFAALCLAAVVKVSGIPFKFMSRGLKPIIFLIVLTVAINMFSIPGTVIWSWWKLTLTVEGVQRAVFMAVRLIMLIFGSSLLTLTTKPIQLTDGMEAYLAPLSKIGVPSHEIAMMLSIALRFIPTLLEETDKIMKAQTARGADFESGKLRERARALVPLLVPLFVSAFRIAGDLAMAMEARCYHGGEGRTRMNGMRFRRGDLIAALLLALFVVITIIIRNTTLV